MGTMTQAADWRLEPISGADRDVVEIIGLPPEQEVFAGSLDEVFGRLNETDAVGLEQGFAVIEPGGTPSQRCLPRVRAHGTASP